jgi:hypothetical protein
MSDIKETSGVEVNLKKVIESWARQMAKKSGTDFQWTDLPYENLETKNCKRYINGEVTTLNAESGRVVYLQDSRPLPVERKEKSEKFSTIKNNSDSTVEHTVGASASISETRSHTFTWELNLGISVKAPFADTGIDLKLDLSSAKEQSQTITDTFSKEFKISVKPRTLIVCRIEVWKIPSVEDFTVDVILTGDVPIKFHDHVKYNKGELIKDRQGKRKHFIPITEIFEIPDVVALLPKELKYRIKDKTVILTQSGQLKTDSIDSQMIVDKEQSLLPDDQKASKMNTSNMAHTDDLETVRKSGYKLLFDPSVTVEANTLEVSIDELNKIKGVQSNDITGMIVSVMTDKSGASKADSDAAVKVFREVHQGGIELAKSHKGPVHLKHAFHSKGHTIKFSPPTFDKKKGQNPTSEEEDGKDDQSPTSDKEDGKDDDNQS